MSDKIVTSITLYGDIDSSSASWLKWYEDAKELACSLGYEGIHVSIESSTIHLGKVHKINRYEKRLLTTVNSGDEVEWVAVISLPPDYSSASFDYDFYLIRNLEYVNLIMNKNDFECADKDMLLEVLKRHVALKEGEIYEMDRDECPFIYAAKANPQSFFTTLKVIKKFS